MITMNMKHLVVGSMGVNCYIVYNENACVVIDPGDDYPKIEDAISEIGKPLEAILLTHAHFDHVGALKELKNAHPEVPVLLGEGDEEHFSDPVKVYKKILWKIPENLYLAADRLVKDGEMIDVKGMAFTVMHTPGHTAGSVCYLYEDAVFSGDTLFRGTCGRSDFYSSDPAQMKVSLARLMALEGDRRVFPGHQAATTLDRERKYNPFVGR